MNQRRAPLSHFLHTKFIRISIAAAVISLVALGVAYSSRSASSNAIKPPRHSSINALLMPFQETIDTFAADCTTPKSSFVLGETVCAKTDSVDLNFPGGRWVHWLRSDLSIAFGGSGITDIT